MGEGAIGGEGFKVERSVELWIERRWMLLNRDLFEEDR